MTTTSVPVPLYRTGGQFEQLDIQATLEGNEFRKVLAISIKNMWGSGRETIAFLSIHQLLLELLPGLGFTHTVDAKGERWTHPDAPVCVGGPYDGRRLPKPASGFFHVVRVVNHLPFGMTAKESDREPAPPPEVGEYRILDFQHAPETPWPASAPREIWWWYSPEDLRR